jgi:hypothetical protein
MKITKEFLKELKESGEILETCDKINIAIVGSRNFYDFKKMAESIESIINVDNIGFIISGGAKGADTLAERYADLRNISIRVFKADWLRFGSSAGPKRNIKIIAACDICFAFPTRGSKGTRHDIDLCKKTNKICYVFES